MRSRAMGTGTRAQTLLPFLNAGALFALSTDRDFETPASKQNAIRSFSAIPMLPRRSLVRFRIINSSPFPAKSLPLFVCTFNEPVDDRSNGLPSQPACASGNDSHTASSTQILSPQSGASTIASFLVKEGVTTFFGIPGRPIAPLFEALRHQAGVRLILSRQESNAIFGAIGYYYATGRVAAVLVTAGPGLTNTLTAISSAHFMGTPVLIIAGDVSGSNDGLYIQDLGPQGIHADQILLLVSRAVIRVSGPRSLLSQTAEALTKARNPIDAGPSVLIVPANVSVEPVTTFEISHQSPIFTIVPSKDAVDKTASLLSCARRPLLVLGGNCRNFVTEISNLIEVLGIPFVCTPMAKGLVDERHRLCLRCCGLGSSEWIKNYMNRGVDVALVLGTNLLDCEVRHMSFREQFVRVIHVNSCLEAFNRNVPTALGIVADTGSFCMQLQKRFVRDEEFDERISDLVSTVKQAAPFTTPVFAETCSKLVPPHEAILALGQAVPRNTFVVSDVGEHALFAIHYLTIEHDMEFLIDLSFGSMGNGISQSIGVALACQPRTVLCICGDGCMAMSGMEVLTAVSHRLRLIFAVFNDSCYNMVHHGMKQAFGSADAFETPIVDFAAWAEAMGMKAARITHSSQINGDLLDSLLSEGLPALLDIRIARQCLSAADRNDAIFAAVGKR